MVDFKQIMCPIDFSDTSVGALRCAITLASWYQARLTVLHVATTFEPDSGFDSADQADGPPRRGSREDILRRIRTAMEQAGVMAIDARPLALEGRATELIVDGAAAGHSDLLVIGTHGRGGFHRLVLGSIAEKVVRIATCPVLTVPPSALDMTRGAIEFRKILCPVDFSRSSLRALAYALDIGRRSGGCVTVLSVLEYLNPEESDVQTHPTIRKRRRHFVAQERERLHAVVAAEAGTGCGVEEIVVVHRAYKEILQRASTAKTNLIVMGAQGSGGVELLLYGSTTQHVVRSATCPVLTVRA